MKEKIQMAVTVEKKCGKEIPLGLVLLDNIPTISMFILGALIIYPLSHIYSIIYLIYSAASIVWFWARICPFCAHYNTLSCPCGYGIISAKFFKRRTDKEFKKVFKANIITLFPCWIVPLLLGLYLLLYNFSLPTLFYLLLFSITAFLVIPLISKLVGCKNCETKEECPWMNKC
jgi:hypothetical protein